MVNDAVQPTHHSYAGVFHIPATVDEGQDNCDNLVIHGIYYIISLDSLFQ